MYDYGEIGDNSIDYYFVNCRSTHAKLFPQLFSRGQTGKCVYTVDKQWLTPTDFQFYCGSWHNDWKNRIKVKKPFESEYDEGQKTSRRKRKNQITLKKLIEEHKLDAVHSYYCQCDSCLDYSYLKVRILVTVASF